MSILNDDKGERPETLAAREPITITTKGHVPIY